MYEVPLRIFYVQLLFFGTKIPMLLAPLIDSIPYLFYAKNICHLYSLLAPMTHCELHFVGMDDTHTDLFRHCSS